MKGIALDTYVCGCCGSEQSAEVQPCTCPRCGHFGPVRDFPTRKTLTIRKQNDSFRAGLIVGGCPFPGTVVVTSGVSERGRDFVTNAIMAAAFDTDFSEDNDPWGTRDFGTVTVQGDKLYWKIDYFDAAREYGSDDPSDPAKTHRVLTLLFPAEY